MALSEPDEKDYMQGMNLALQLIAALITLAVMVTLYFGLHGLFDAMEPQFVYGAVFGGAFMTIIFALALWLDKSEGRIPGGRAEQERSRHTIDL